MASPILSRFRATNDAPSDQEFLEVRAIAVTAQKDLRTTKAQISRLIEGRAGSETSMKALRRQDDSLRQTIKLCRSILSAVRRISPEILAYIFLLSVPSIEEAREDTVYWYQSLKRSPWILGHISRRWRAVALATPALWSTIVTRNMNDDEEELYSLPMLETQLARSGRAPLMIIFDWETYDGELDTYNAEKVLKVLIKHSPRWKYLHITGSMLMRLSGVRGRLPLLEKLFVRGRDDEKTDDGYSPPPPVDYLVDAPRLRSVEVDDGFPFFALPWAQLTRYEGMGPWGGHISALMYLKNVESCSFMIAHEADLHDPYTWGNTTVQLSKLRELEISTERRFEDIEQYWVWPKWLRVPALTELDIPAGLIKGLPKFQHASRFSLRKLDIGAGCPGADALRPVLESNRNISELAFSPSTYIWDPDHTKVPDLIALLTYKRHRPDLLSKLETLVVRSPSGEHEDTVGRMIVSRWRTTRLRAVRAVDVGPGLAATLDRLKSQGLDVSVTMTM